MQLCYLVGMENKENTTGANALKFIESALSEGRTVYISTATRNTAISPGCAQRWRNAGNSLFKLNSAGDLLMASGLFFVRLTSGTICLARLSAE